MIKARDRMNNQIQWSIGKGNIDFWDDVWMKDKPIREFGNPGMRLPCWKVNDFWNNNDWDRGKLTTELIPIGVPEEVVNEIGQIPIDATGKDTMRWMLTPHGNFSTTSAWELVRHHQPKAEVFRLVWDESLLPSISIFVWRLLANRIPVDEKLQWRRIQLASKCRCCKSPSSESREHLFISGTSAKKIWDFFSGWFPSIPSVRQSVTDMEIRVRYWHRNLQNPPGNHISMILPCLIVWNIWAERNSVNHRGTIFNAGVVTEKVIGQLQTAIWAKKLKANQWRGCVPSVSFAFPFLGRAEAVRSCVVEWKPPPTEWIKLNSDGSFVAGNSIAGGGGVIRDDKGFILKGFSGQFEAHSGWEAEVKALMLGLKFAKDLNNHVWIELDANDIVTLINEKKMGCGKHRHLLTSLRNELHNIIFTVSHIPREGNKIADYLAEKGRQGVCEDFDSKTAHPYVKALATLDQRGMPNFRHSNENRTPSFGLRV